MRRQEFTESGNLPRIPQEKIKAVGDLLDQGINRPTEISQKSGVDIVSVRNILKRFFPNREKARPATSINQPSQPETLKRKSQIENLIDKGIHSTTLISKLLGLKLNATSHLYYIYFKDKVNQSQRNTSLERTVNNLQKQGIDAAEEISIITGLDVNVLKKSLGSGTGKKELPTEKPKNVPQAKKPFDTFFDSLLLAKKIADHEEYDSEKLKKLIYRIFNFN